MKVVYRDRQQDDPKIPPLKAEHQLPPLDLQELDPDPVVSALQVWKKGGDKALLEELRRRAKRRKGGRARL